MNDVFKEQLVKKAKRAKDRIFSVGIIVNAIIIFIIYLGVASLIPVLQIFVPFIFVMLILACWHLIRRRNQEFEYAITNNEIDIDVIISKSRRKRVFSGYIRDIEAFRPLGSSEFEHTFSQVQAEKDFSSGRPEVVRYEFVANFQGQKMRIVVEPNEDLLASFKSHLKRGISKFN